MEISLMQSLMDMVVLGLDKGYRSRSLQFSSYVKKIGCVTLSHKEVIVVDLHYLGLHVLSVEESTRASA